MELHFSKEEEALRQVVQRFAQEEVAPAVPQMEETDEFPIHIVKRMGELGLMGIPIPKKYDGQGLSYTAYIIAIHELAKVSPTVGVILSVHTSVGTNPILKFGTEEQKQAYIPQLARGQYLGAFAVTEPSAGSDVSNMKTRAVRMGDHYQLSGSKLFITNGEFADTFIVFALTDPTQGKKGISAFIVERGTKGLTVGNKERKMGLHGSSTVSLHFENALVPEKNRLGNEGEGFHIAMANLNAGRIGIAAQALGIAEGAFQLALNHAKKQRHIFDKTAKAHHFKLADLSTRIEAARLLIYRTAHMIEQGVPCIKEASMAKLFASQCAMDTAISAVQIFDCEGLLTKNTIERYFRDAKITQIYEGTNEIQHLVIAKQLLNGN